MTLMFSALIMVALIDYIFVSINANHPRSVRLLILRVLLTAMAIDMGAVGFFLNNRASHDIHDHLASFLVYFIIVLIVGIRWFLPKIPKEFCDVVYCWGYLGDGRDSV